MKVTAVKAKEEQPCGQETGRNTDHTPKET
jgi:hypothetical protein